MNADIQERNERFDTVKLSLAVLLLGAGIAAFYFLAAQPLVVRVLSAIAGLVAAVVVGRRTAKGQEIASFLRDSQIEVRRVVWPTRQETLQTTLVIIGVTVVVALFLWVLDALLGWLVKSLTGQA